MAAAATERFSVLLGLEVKDFEPDEVTRTELIKSLRNKGRSVRIEAMALETIQVSKRGEKTMYNCVLIARLG
jgi:hypothetical protein